MGANCGTNCVRDCERTAHELYSSDGSMGGQLGIPGHVAAGSAPAASVKVGATFADPMAAISGRGAGAAGTAGMAPIQGLGALRQTEPGPSTDNTPRFEEMSPRGSVAGEVPTPLASPRSPSPGEAKQDAGGMEEVCYVGERLDGMKHGQGKLQTKGSTFEGEFSRDMRHGKGVLTWDDGRQFCGQFEDNKFHGTAVMNWPDGRKYTGDYFDDRKHGEGTFSWQDGRRYQGQWVVGKRHGIGVYTNAKGITRTGMWQMDRPLHWDAVAPAQLPGQNLPSQGLSPRLPERVLEADMSGEAVAVNDPSPADVVV